MVITNYQLRAVKCGRAILRDAWCVFFKIFFIFFLFLGRKLGLHNSNHLYKSEPLADGRNSWNQPAAYCLLIQYKIQNTRISSPEKAVKIIRYFFKCGWYRQSAAFRLMTERQSLHHSQCNNFFGLRLIKHWKIHIAYRQWRWNFPRRE